jgi:hypothetical protein
MPTTTENVDMRQADASRAAWYSLTPEDVAKRLDVAQAGSECGEDR